MACTMLSSLTLQMPMKVASTATVMATAAFRRAARASVCSVAALAVSTMSLGSMSIVCASSVGCSDAQMRVPQHIRAARASDTLPHSSHDDHTIHVFVARSAEHVAVELEAAGLRRCQPHPGDDTGNDVGAYAESGCAEAHRHLDGSEFEHDGFALLDQDLVRNEDEFFRDDGDDPFIVRRDELDRAQAETQSCRGAEDAPTFGIDAHAHAFTTGRSSTSHSADFTPPSISRKPR